MMSRLFTLATFALLTLIATQTTAYAQEQSEWEKNSQLVTTIGVLTVTSTTVYFLQGLSDRILDKMFEKVAIYMRENAVALQQDVSLGAGSSLDDLCAIFNLEASQRRAVGQRLKAHRVELVAILSKARITEADARRLTTLALTQAV